jgi:hypothetical protein
MATPNRYVLCVKNRGHAAALEVRKVYRLLSDAADSKRGLLRVVDESGDDSLYPADFFVPIVLPRQAIRAFVTKSA